MTVLEAAETVLHQAGCPLHYREITKRMLEQGIWHTDGKTPWDSVKARLSVRIDTDADRCTFQRTGKGIFALRAWGLAEYLPPKKAAVGPPDTQRSVPTLPLEDHQPQTPPSTPVSKTTLSFADAAARVLAETSNQQPIHYQAITKVALEKGYLHSAGKTPAATLYSVILTEIQRQAQQGLAPRFVKHGKGMVGLSAWAPVGLAQQISQHNKAIREQMLARLKTMPPAEFEDLIGKLLGEIGFEEITQTSYSGDGGIDVRGTMVVGGVIRTSMAVQAKRWKPNVQAPVVQQVRGSLGTHEQGLIITTSDFSAGARAEASRANTVPVALMNGEHLVALLVEHGIGVTRETYDLLSLSEDRQAEDDLS